ncbi:MAG: PAS domain-containing protein [Demequina sp.]
MATTQKPMPRAAAVGAAVAAAVAMVAMITDQPAATTALATAAMVLALVVAVVAIRNRPDASPAPPARQGQSSEDLNAVRRVSRIGTWEYHYESRLVTWSDEVAAIFGRPAGYRPTPEEWLGQYVPGDLERVNITVRRAVDAGRPFMEEWTINAADGARRTILIIGESVRDESGEPLHLHGTIQDLTPWREAESSAETQNRRFTELTNSLPIAVWSATADGVVDYVSEALATYGGGDVKEYVGEGWLTLLHPEDQDSMSDRWANALRTGQPYDVEVRVRNRDGEYRWHRVSAKPEHDDAGEVSRWWGSSIDVHRTRVLEQRAHQLAHDREVILDSISDGVLAIDEDWRILYLNDHAQTMLGRNEQSLVGRKLFAEYPNLENTPTHEAYRAAMATGEAQFLSAHNEQEQKWFDIKVTPSALGLTVFFRDTTQARILAEQLEQAQRLEAVGRLTGGIAHDFNNLLTVVIGGADAASRDPGISDGSREMIGLVRQAAERGAQLTGRLLAFARRQPLTPRHTDINRLLAEFEPLLHRTLGDGITIDTNWAPRLPPALVDPSQFESAVLNLAINARDAMPGGGTLTLETKVKHLDEAYVTAHAEVEPGTYVVVTVTDSGTGIAPEVLDQLFDPFFTTKEVGHGSGMGLPMVWGFARQSGGHVTVYSEVGHGTSFRLYLPLAPGAAAVVEPNPVAGEAPPHGSGVILLAEDDPLVRSFATEHLRSMGYEVVSASTGPQALELLATMETVDLLFTDVIMPEGMSGRDLAERVVAQRPGTPVLYASGYTENVIMHNGKLDEGVALLAKPYSAQELAVHVHAQMSARPREPR